MTEHDKVAVRREPKKRSSKPKEASDAPALPESGDAPALPEPSEAAALAEPTEAAAPSAAPEPSPVESAPEVETRPTFVKEAAPPPAPRVAAPSYTVVARRYRPQRFEDVVGQDHVVQSLKNAIRLNRIAQAYLFAGTRGVGKTSIARIFAKCLNCAKGPTASPCQTCDICQAIAVGQDVDVIEIDGASNNGVEQVRELRQNASLRPSRGRYKIYYIDEVHMLSTGAFNALLKTLEEPPSHVKFLFATTEPNKIPITVLSRCQRYDFAGITPEAIAGTLGEICTREGMEYEPEALHVVARRAGGSLRDAQSLLDRLLASGTPKLSVDVVHSLLGTASDERLLKMLGALANHDAAAALGLLEQSAAEGVQPADLLGGLIDLIRDAMMLALGADTVLLAVSPRNRDELKAIALRWTLQPLMASVQILGECRSRMRGSVYGRLLLEVALVRIARLEELASLSELVERLAALESGTPPPRRPDSGSVRMTASTPEAKAPAIAQPPAPIEVAAPARPAVTPARTEAARVLPSEPPASPPSEASQVPQAPPVAPPNSELKTKESDGPPAQAVAAPNGAARRSDDSQPAPAPVVFEPPALPPAARAEAIGTAPVVIHHDVSTPLDLDAVRNFWPDLMKKVDKRLALTLTQVEPIGFDGSDVLVISVKQGYNSTFGDVSTPEAQTKIAQALGRLVHRPVNIKYVPRTASDHAQTDSSPTEGQRADSLSKDPLVQRLLELFEARPVQMDYGDDDISSEN